MKKTLLAIGVLLVAAIAGVAVWATTVPCLQCVLTPDEFHPAPLPTGASGAAPVAR